MGACGGALNWAAGGGGPWGCDVTATYVALHVGSCSATPTAAADSGMDTSAASYCASAKSVPLASPCCGALSAISLICSSVHCGIFGALSCDSRASSSSISLLTGSGAPCALARPRALTCSSSVAVLSVSSSYTYGVQLWGGGGGLPLGFLDVHVSARRADP